MIRLAILVFITLTLGQATPAVSPSTLKPNSKKPVKTASKVEPTATVLSDIAPPEQPEAQPAPTPVVYPADHVALMQQAGIASSDYGAVDYIVSHESGWDPDSTNASSGAHGLPQALPYSKTGCGWSDPICQLSWADTYATARYGGWWPAQAYWAIHFNW